MARLRSVGSGGRGGSGGLPRQQQISCTFTRQRRRYADGQRSRIDRRRRCCAIANATHAPASAHLPLLQKITRR